MTPTEAKYVEKLKVCNVCKQEQPLCNFYKEKGYPDGHRAICIGCDKKRALIRYYRSKNNESIMIKREKNKKHYKNNKDILLVKAKLNYAQNANARIKQKREYINNKKIVDPIFKILINLRTRTSQCFKKISENKNVKTKDLLGIELSFLKIYIEKQFIKGMTWENYGEWEVDHKLPLSNAKTKNELIELCHYTNLQPLWKSNNRSKRNKIVEHQRKIVI